MGYQSDKYLKNLSVHPNTSGEQGAYLNDAKISYNRKIQIKQSI